MRGNRQTLADIRMRCRCDESGFPDDVMGLAGNIAAGGGRLDGHPLCGASFDAGHDRERALRDDLLRGSQSSCQPSRWISSQSTCRPSSSIFHDTALHKSLPCLIFSTMPLSFPGECAPRPRQADSETWSTDQQLLSAARGQMDIEDVLGTSGYDINCRDL